jgi:serine protease AprX
VTNKDAYGIRVLNLSIGTDSKQSYKVDPLDFAVERVWNSGIVVVVAAGNHGTASGTISKPGDDPFVITVGSSDDHTTNGISDDTLAPFSGVGPTQDGLAKPDVLAPGRSVVSSRSPGSTIDVGFSSSEIGASYFTGSGTSFSAAVVSGEAALILSRTWSMNPNQVKRRIMNNASTSSSIPAAAQGAGLVNAYQATMGDGTAEANRYVTPATGGGSLQASRGTYALYNADGTLMTDDQANAALGFNPVAYFGSQWAGSQWNGSQWAGSQWAGSQWAGSQWAGSQWAGSQWAGSQWNGSQWAGGGWTGSQWAGSQWAGSQWNGVTGTLEWSGSQWY